MSSVLMVRPDHYDVVYEINPWMSRARPADRERAQVQWTGLYECLTSEFGVEVLLAEPHPDLPDMVFTANAGLIRGRRAVLSRFRHRERQGESAQFRCWFESSGYEVLELPPDCVFEGEGDALFLGDTLFAGYHFRSDVRSHRLTGELLGARVLSLQLTDPRFYHLDTCFCPLNPDTAAWYPPAFDEYACRVLESNVGDLIAVSAEEAARFACNAVVIDRRVALNTGCPGFEASLRARGFAPRATALDEFIKAGGSAKCLTLHLD